MGKNVPGREWLMVTLVVMGLVAVVVLFVPLRREGQKPSSAKAVATGQPSVEAPPRVAAGPDRLSGDVFADLRLERERGRSRQEEMFSKIVADPATQSDLRTAAQQESWRLTRQIALEGELEGLLRAEGYPQVLVMLRDSEATVIIQSVKLIPDEVAGIAALVSQIAGVSPENIQVHEND